MPACTATSVLPPQAVIDAYIAVERQQCAATFQSGNAPDERGTAVLRGLRVFPPCVHLANLLGDRAILKYLAYCGGIGAEVVDPGTISVNDEVIAE